MFLQKKLGKNYEHKTPRLSPHLYLDMPTKQSRRIFDNSSKQIDSDKALFGCFLKNELC